MNNIKYVVSLPLVLENIKNIKEYTQCKFCAVVKADAYGHNMTAFSPKIESEVDFFGVTTFGEALILRNANIKKPILIMGKCDSASECIEYDLTISCISLKHIKTLAEKAKGKALNIHIKYNSGMNRLGVKTVQDVLAIINYAKSNNIKVCGFFTHFATGFCDADFLNYQNKNFAKIIKTVKKHLPDIIIHAANTPACFVTKKCCYDMVRIGLGMYGYADLPPGYSRPVKVSPVLTITAKIVQIINIKAGERVGYGNLFIADKPMKVGVVGIGYADGVKKANTNGEVYVNGQKTYIIGSVCMDMLTVDLTNIKASENDDVVILDDAFGLNASVLAKRCGTVTADILASFNYGRADYIIKE